MKTHASQSVDKRPAEEAASKRWWLKRLLPLLGIAGTFVTMTLLYFGYDYVAARAAPCEVIFRQTKLGLSTKISFLKTEGELKLGREPLTELSERAQMTALNLKTCCTVLDAGKVNPEQFLQCKAKARAYQTRVDNIVTVVRQVAAVETTGSNSATAASNQIVNASATKPTAAPSITSAKSEIKTQFEAARAISKEFNKDVVQVRKAQALETLKIQAPRHVDVTAKEREPNNDALNTNVVEIGKWITASIGAGGDRDFFAFTTPEKYRDWIKIEVENRSTTLEPRIELFDAAKAKLGANANTTPGANLKYDFVAAPGTRFVARISAEYGRNVGAYLFRVTAYKSYDSHEPNGSILTARNISGGVATPAAIMDGRDYDFFRVEADQAAKQIEIKVSNRSTKLRPRIELFNDSKAKIGAHANATGGADLTYTAKIAPGTHYYILVRDEYSSATGAYDLTVSFKP